MEYPVKTIMDIGHRKRRKLDSARPETHNSDKSVSHLYNLAATPKPLDPLYSGSSYTGRGPGHSGLSRKAAESGKRKMLDGMSVGYIILLY